MHFLLMLPKSLCEGFVAIFHKKNLLCAALHEVGISRDSYAFDDIAFAVLHGDGKTAAFLLHESILTRIFSGLCKVDCEDLNMR